MTDSWGFLLQTLTASEAALLLLLVKAMFRDKLSPRWQFGIWSILGLVLLIPAGLGGRYSLLNWPLWLEALKSQLTGDYMSITRVWASLPLPSAQTAGDWLFWLYLAGVLFLLGRYALAYIRLRRAHSAERARALYQALLRRADVVRARGTLVYDGGYAKHERAAHPAVMDTVVPNIMLSVLARTLGKRAECGGVIPFVVGEQFLLVGRDRSRIVIIARKEIHHGIVAVRKNVRRSRSGNPRTARGKHDRNAYHRSDRRQHGRHSHASKVRRNTAADHRAAQPDDERNAVNYGKYIVIENERDEHIRADTAKRKIYPEPPVQQIQQCEDLGENEQCRRGNKPYEHEQRGQREV